MALVVSVMITVIAGNWPLGLNGEYNHVVG